MSESVYNPLSGRFVKRDGSVGKQLKDIASVLLYCHGRNFDIDPEILDLLNLSYTLIDKKEPKRIDSINIGEQTDPTILSRDGNLPVEFSGVFNVVVDYNCDYTGWAVTPGDFARYTIPLYQNMVRALNPEAWCLITSFENTENFAPSNPKMRKRMEDQEKKRLDFIKDLVTNHFGNFSMMQEGNSKRIYTIFYGGSRFVYD